MWQRHPEEMKKLLKYGTPSDELIKLADKKFEYTVRGKKKFRSFPDSLYKSSGQKLLFSTVLAFESFKKDIPVLAYVTYKEIAAQIRLRRADATANLHMVAEAIFYRAAVEFKSQVLFSFDSINAWISEKYNKTLGYQTIRKAIEFLESKFYLEVVEWGVRGNRRHCTKLSLSFTKETCASFLMDSDEWIFQGYAAFKAVQAREISARQDVLEVHIQRYLARIEKEESAPVWESVPRLFPKADDRISVVTPTGVTSTEKDILNETYINRFLGGLVPSLQENVSCIGSFSSGVPKQPRSG